MVKIRLMRVGKRKQPAFRVVVADARSPRDGRIIEAIGHYQPRRDPSEISIDNERAVYWLRQGAQPSNTVRKLLELEGAWGEFTGKGGGPTKQEGPKKATAAASVKATPAASVSGDEIEDLPADEPPAEVEEAADQAPAAPDADTGEEPASS